MRQATINVLTSDPREVRAVVQFEDGSSIEVAVEKHDGLRRIRLSPHRRFRLQFAAPSDDSGEMVVDLVGKEVDLHRDYMELVARSTGDPSGANGTKKNGGSKHGEEGGG